MADAFLHSLLSQNDALTMKEWPQYILLLSMLKPFGTWMMRVTFLGLLQTAFVCGVSKISWTECPYTCMKGEMIQNGIACAM